MITFADDTSCRLHLLTCEKDRQKAKECFVFKIFENEQIQVSEKPLSVLDNRSNIWDLLTPGAFGKTRVNMAVISPPTKFLEL